MDEILKIESYIEKGKAKLPKYKETQAENETILKILVLNALQKFNRIELDNSNQEFSTYQILKETLQLILTDIEDDLISNGMIMCIASVIINGLTEFKNIGSIYWYMRRWKISKMISFRS